MAARSVMPSRGEDCDSEGEDSGQVITRKMPGARRQASLANYGDKMPYRMGSESPVPTGEGKAGKNDGEVYRQMAKNLLGTESAGLSNELSAPYEVPQFPIEQIETKLLKVQKEFGEGGAGAPLPGGAGVREPSIGVVPDIEDECAMADFVAHYQRVNISGEDNTGVPMEDLQTASKLLVQALSIREKYMTVSRQYFPASVARYLRQVDGKTVKYQAHEDRATIEGDDDVNQRKMSVVKLVALHKGATFVISLQVCTDVPFSQFHTIVHNCTYLL